MSIFYNHFEQTSDVLKNRKKENPTSKIQITNEKYLKNTENNKENICGYKY